MKKNKEIDETKSNQFSYEPKLNQVLEAYSIRENGTIRLQYDFQYCPSMTEQHTAHMTDLNYLVGKHKPDELMAYLAARRQHRQEILGHDFSKEPSILDAKNVVVKMRNAFENLPEEVSKHFRNHVEFLRFIDNPENTKKMLSMGLLVPKQIAELKGEPASTPTPTPTTPTQEKEEKAKAKA